MASQIPCRPSLRTYSKRGSQGNQEPSKKRQRIDKFQRSCFGCIAYDKSSLPELPEDISTSHLNPLISHYSTSSSPQHASECSSDKIEERQESPPSSPPPTCSSVTKTEEPRPKRRLSLYPNLAIINRIAIKKRFEDKMYQGNNPQPSENDMPPIPTEDNLTIDFSGESSDSEYHAQRAALGLQDRSNIRSTQNHLPKVRSLLSASYLAASRPPRDSLLVKNMEPRYQEQKSERRRARSHHDTKGTGKRAKSLSSAESDASTSSGSFAATEGATFEICAQHKPGRNGSMTKEPNAGSGAYSADYVEGVSQDSTRVTKPSKVNTFSNEPSISAGRLGFGMNYGTPSGGNSSIVTKTGGTNTSENSNSGSSGVNKGSSAQGSGGLSNQSNIGSLSSGGSASGGSDGATDAGSSGVGRSSGDTKTNSGNTTAHPSLNIGGGLASSAPGPSKLTQTTLTGGKSVVKCGQCGTLYNKAIEADRKEHAQICEDHIHGIAIEPNRLFKEARVKQIHRTIDEDGNESFIVMINRASSQYWKDLAGRVLDSHVDRDLNTSQTLQQQLWTTIPDPDHFQDDKVVSNNEQTKKHVPRFSVLLYVRKSPIKGNRTVPRVVGALLAERISYAYEIANIQITHDEFGAWPSEVAAFQVVERHPDEPLKVCLGVNKIWAHQDHRRKGIGRQLLDTTRDHFLNWTTLLKSEVAFTAPTSMGYAFSKKYMHPDGLPSGEYVLFHQYNSED